MEEIKQVNNIGDKMAEQFKQKQYNIIIITQFQEVLINASNVKSLGCISQVLQ